jgi:crossover junction endodeoxyribonuclease RusA
MTYEEWQRRPKIMATLETGYEDPPLRSNKRLHHMAEHRIKRDIRQAGRIRAMKWMTGKRAEGWMFPLGQAVEVRMTWYVPTKHRRDADSGQPTLKSFLDGIVDAGVLADDNYRHVRRAYCEVEHTPGEPMRLVVEIREAT